MKTYILIFGLLLSIKAFGQVDNSILEGRLPLWFNLFFNKSDLSKQYSISDYNNPFYLEGDFNGDNVIDIAVSIKNIKTQKMGILIVHGKTNQCYILGAGNKFGNGGDNFKWMDIWRVYRDKDISSDDSDTKKVNLKNLAIWVEKSETFSAVIYWDGKFYQWYQLGI
jgi:hypothetical protein